MRSPSRISTFVSAAARASLARGFDETRGTFDPEHSASGAHDLREIRRRIARTGADIEHAPAMGDADAVPAIRHRVAPDAMLQAEPCDFVVVRPEHVIGLTCAAAHNCGSCCVCPIAPIGKLWTHGPEFGA